jgi:hypothetical protein
MNFSIPDDVQRYRITEGSEKIQLRRVSGILFGRRAKRG